MSKFVKAFEDNLMMNYGVPQTSFVKGQGAYLWDDQGKKYLDFLCGLAVTSLGHAHPEITEVISSQAATLTHVSNLFANEHQGQLGAEINSLISPNGEISGKTFFCNSGAEANEAAIKLARKYGLQNRRGNVIVSTWGGFHGRTLGSLAATGQPAKWEGFAPLPEGFRHVEWNKVSDLQTAVGDDVAAIIVEPIQAEGGVHPASQEFMVAIRQICDEQNILFIADEVQTGMARTGEWFGFQHYGVTPDVVTMAKALGNGFPIGACWARDLVASSFSPGDHGSTFGGNPLGAAVARKVIEIMKDLDLPTQVSKTSEILQNALLGLSTVEGIRGHGLLLAIEFEDSIAKEVTVECLKNGLIVNAVTPTAIRLAPPLIISETEIREAIEVLEDAIKSVIANMLQNEAGSQQ